MSGSSSAVAPCKMWQQLRAVCVLWWNMKYCPCGEAVHAKSETKRRKCEGRTVSDGWYNQSTIHAKACTIALCVMDFQGQNGEGYITTQTIQFISRKLWPRPFGFPENLHISWNFSDFLKFWRPACVCSYIYVIPELDLKLLVVVALLL